MCVNFFDKCWGLFLFGCLASLVFVGLVIWFVLHLIAVAAESLTTDITYSRKDKE